MNYIDIIIGIILILAFLRGFKNGLVVELASLAALVLGVLGAIKFSSMTEKWLLNYIHSSYMGIISFLITFVVIVIVVHVIAKAVDKMVKAIALGLVNKLLGGAFSFIKIGFILSILMSVFASLDRTFDVIPKDTRDSSILYEPLVEFAPDVFPYLHFDKTEIEESIKGAK